jgi:hypothetical protein
MKQIHLKNNTIWSCISELLRYKNLTCNFISYNNDSAPIHSVRAKELIMEGTWRNSLQLIPLTNSIFPSSIRSIGLFTGFDELLTQDPVKY